MKCLVAVPRKPGLHPFFQACLEKYRAAFPVENLGWQFDWHFDDGAYEGSRLVRIAAARNAILERLADHDYVLSLDADLVAVPFKLPSLLHAASPDGITAPLVLIEGTDAFYDTSGFLENGRPVRHKPPYFDQDGELIDLDSVGCVYLAPAALFRDFRYEDDPSGPTDHLGLCAAARGRGYPVRCLTSAAAHHAHLPLYGEEWR